MRIDVDMPNVRCSRYLAASGEGFVAVLSDGSYLTIRQSEGWGGVLRSYVESTEKLNNASIFNPTFTNEAVGKYGVPPFNLIPAKAVVTRTVTLTTGVNP